MRKILIGWIVILGLMLFNSPGACAFEKWGKLHVDEARIVIKLLDDLYKYAVVFMTENYVKDPGAVPAATTAKEVFKEMEKKGWHSARVITATERFFNPDNKPKDDFEKEAVQALSAGKDYFEKVETQEGQKVLRAATPLPLVMAQCKFCHVYAKEGELMGAITYTLPIAD